MTQPAALITGGASGIGHALVKRLASQGYNLTILDVDGEALLQLHASCLAAGVDCFVVAADVCSNEAQERVFAEHMRRFGRLDLAVLNAGIGERVDFLAPSNTGYSHEKTLDIDLRAVITGVRLAARAMTAGNADDGGSRAGAATGGCIVAIASAAGIFPVPAGPVYAAAKAGVVHLVRSLAPRLAARGVRVAALCPQYVDTPLVRTMLEQDPDMAKAMMGPCYSQPLLQPSHVVDQVMHLAAAPRPTRGDFAAGDGCVVLLLQQPYAKTLDPFRRRPAAKQQRQPLPAESGGGRRGSTVGGGAAAGAAAAAAAASAAFAGQALPGSFQKWQVVALSPDFRAATRLVSTEMPAAAALPAGSVLIRRTFAGINASDINYTSGRYHGSAAAAQHALPYDAGFESVGVVVAAARDVASELPPGTAVATMEAGFSEYGLSPARRCLRVPAPSAQVLALLTSGLTASIALEEVGGLSLPGRDPSSGGGSGDGGSESRRSGGGGSGGLRTVLVTAAAGGTGQFAVQLAKLAGCRVVATCGGEDKAALLRRLGADRVINYKFEDLKAVLKAEFPKGVDLVYESVGGDMFDTCVDAMAPRATLIVIGMMSRYGAGWPPSSHPGLTEKLLWKSAAVAGFFLLRYAHLWGQHLQRLVALEQQGRLQVALDTQAFVGVDTVPDAVARLQSGASSGKVVVQLAPQLPTAPAARL